MSRHARKISESGIYHIMIRGINKQQIFIDEEDYEKFLWVLKDTKEISEYKLYAYCLMDNHIHLLIKVGKEPLQIIFKRIGNRFVYWYNTKYQRVGHLFQDRYKSEVVENEEYFLTVLRYIHQNPLKAGICENISDYKYSSYNEYLSTPWLTNTKAVLKILPEEQFVDFHQSFDTQVLLEPEERASNITDTQLYKKISDSSFFDMSSDAKKAFIIDSYNEGAPIRQLARLTGLSRKLITKWIEE